MVLKCMFKGDTGEESVMCINCLGLLGEKASCQRSSSWKMVLKRPFTDDTSKDDLEMGIHQGQQGRNAFACSLFWFFLETDLQKSLEFSA